MNTDWTELAEHYLKLSASSAAGYTAHATNEQIKRLVGSAASKFPRDREADLEWHIRALEHPSHKWFVSKVLAQLSSTPQALLDPLLRAALREPNPSATQLLIAPCVKTFGSSAVLSRSEQLAELHAGSEEGLANIKYWVPRCGA